ncbi:MAG: LptF/LptG family permease, partial [Akkermansiaceae bacterium]|nr:LptF/LptG family permease [Akkermansiaceae bacterium]
MIRISDRYIGKQVMMFTLYAVIVLCFVLVLGNLFKTIQEMLVDQKAPLSLVLRFIASVLPASLMYTLPWGFLSAVLIVFGRMSSHQEITCFRVSGMSLPRLSAPVFILGGVLSLACLWLNVEFVPNAKASMKEMLYEQATRDPNSMLKPGVAQGSFTTDAGGTQKLLIEGRDGHWVQGFHFYELGSEGQGSKYVHATQAALSVDHESNQLRIKLDNAYIETRKPNKRVPDQVFAKHAKPLLIQLEGRRNFRKKPSSMTNSEIREA